MGVVKSVSFSGIAEEEESGPRGDAVVSPVEADFVEDVEGCGGEKKKRSRRRKRGSRKRNSQQSAGGDEKNNQSKSSNDTSRDEQQQQQQQESSEAPSSSTPAVAFVVSPTSSENWETTTRAVEEAPLHASPCQNQTQRSFVPPTQRSFVPACPLGGANPPLHAGSGGFAPGQTGTTPQQPTSGQLDSWHEQFDSSSFPRGSWVPWGIKSQDQHPENHQSYWGASETNIGTISNYAAQLSSAQQFQHCPPAGATAAQLAAAYHLAWQEVPTVYHANGVVYQVVDGGGLYNYQGGGSVVHGGASASHRPGLPAPQALVFRDSPASLVDSPPSIGYSPQGFFMPGK